jgi:hypothetical protein
MRPWILWSWDAPRKRWLEVCAGSQERMTELAAQRQEAADKAEIPECRFVALPTGRKPDDYLIPGILPICDPVEEPPPAEAESLSHDGNCWRSPEHHGCAVAQVERLAVKVDELTMRARRAERALRRSA